MDSLISQDFLLKGIRLDYMLKEFEIDREAKFDQVKKVILDLTKETNGNRSLASHLAQHQTKQKYVGQATVFVSHAWGADWGTTMNALSKHFEGKEESTFLWMSIFMIDQHASKSTNIDFVSWKNTFQEALISIRAALLILSPAENPIAVTRAWCCLEWVIITSHPIKFQYCVDPIDEQNLIQSMIDHSGSAYDHYRTILSRINVANSKSGNPKDEEAILGILREVGYKRVNDIVMNSLKDWFIEAANRGLMQANNVLEKSKILNVKASVQDLLGYHAEALRTNKEAQSLSAEPRDSDVGPWESFSAILHNNRGLILLSLGKLDEAKAEHLEALKIRSKAGFISPHHVVISMNNLGLVAESAQTLPQAQEWYELAIAKDKDFKRDSYQNHGELEPILNLGNVYRLMKNHDHARVQFKTVRQILVSRYGNDHSVQPLYAQLLSSEAVLHLQCQQPDQAATKLEEARETLIRIFHESHPDLADIYQNLANVKLIQNDIMSAKDLAEKSLMIRMQGFPNVKLAALYVLHAKIVEKDLKFKHNQNLRSEYDEDIRRARSVLDELSSEHPDAARLYTSLGVSPSFRKQKAVLM